ncbi:MAG: peptidylprolyl isomerase [Armatimonadetes bacterium]|nr:peptidylprolyl isomerase [Armatimonadota bacterium]
MMKWILLIVLVAAMVGSYNWLNETPTELHREEIQQKPTAELLKSQAHATLTPGSVVELQTNKGQIDFVLFEKDCPTTTKRVAALVAAGAYNGVKFPRVEGWVIQTDMAKAKVKPMGIEVMKGLVNSKGAVGMARTSDPNSNTSIFYILLDPQPGLDGQYTVFGRVIRGMDNVIKIKKGDVIRRAKVRPLTDKDRKDFMEALKIEAERKTQ